MNANEELQIKSCTEVAVEIALKEMSKWLRFVKNSRMFFEANVWKAFSLKNAYRGTPHPPPCPLRCFAPDFFVSPIIYWWLHHSLTTTKPVFVCITEALPKHHNIPDPVDLLTIQNFTLHHNFDKPNLNRGIAIYVQNRNKVSKDISLNEASLKECQWLKIKTLVGLSTLGCIYRSPSPQDHKALLTSISAACQTHQSAFVVSDFNYPRISWFKGIGSTKSPTDKSWPEDHLITCLADHFLMQLESDTMKPPTSLTSC
ncbi:hypothetical protein CAPTEDRAFT_206495 [Capitella teleta]|uniref:Endonuclease/exonuclease/phosphatase domain-containing protein n=1 Tax=Capitella teleta TaxID=283909 RepID=R7T4P0_CAPTE|nr:hypothetical protein CAPTEDRAFT_206495 [Capitella teleta]|eukprot:ELT88032.1 hypothetical protein CAPTEDRAFT_206495 [Capitella teleta]